MTDKFKSNKIGLSSPPAFAEQVTPNDDTDLQFVCRCLNVATAGSVRLTTAEGNEVSIFVAAGITFPVRASRVWATGTTATGIVALS